MVEIMLQTGEIVEAVWMEDEGRFYLDDGRKVRNTEVQVLHTIKEAATALHASYAQVASWLRTKKLPGFQVRGYFWRTTEAALDKFVKPKRGRPKIKRQEVHCDRTNR